MKLDRLKMHQEWFDKNQHLIFLEARIIMQELLAMTREARNQRDEARQIACNREAEFNRMMFDNPKYSDSAAIAAQRGWDYLQDLG